MENSKTKLEVIMGKKGLEKLASSRVAVFGTGGVGSSCVEALARGGVGNLVVVDKDVVQPSNINRQAIAFHSTVGLKKVDVMEGMIHDINPAATVETYDWFILRENIEELLDTIGPVDYVIDAIDTISTKLALAEVAQERGFRLISSMGAANKLHPECFRVDDLFNTVNCPLSRIMRKEARKRGITSLKVLYSCEEPVSIASREGAARSERSNLGTASYVPPIMGQMIAGVVIRELSGVGGDGPTGMNNWRPGQTNSKKRKRK